jgi:hypothetical protein
MPPGTKKVDRTTWFGNPFEVDVHGTRAECVAMFEALITGQRPPDNAYQAHRALFVRPTSACYAATRLPAGARSTSRATPTCC